MRNPAWVQAACRPLIVPRKALQSMEQQQKLMSAHTISLFSNTGYPRAKRMALYNTHTCGGPFAFGQEQSSKIDSEDSVQCTALLECMQLLQVSSVSLPLLHPHNWKTCKPGTTFHFCHQSSQKGLGDQLSEDSRLVGAPPPGLSLTEELLRTPATGDWK